MRLGASSVVLFAVCLGVSASAHHSHGQYDATFSDIEGVVKEVHLLAPHSWVYLDVTGEDGRLEVWALEATSRAGLEKMGVTREYIKPGDTVKARCHRLRDGSSGCLLGFLKAQDGSVKNWDGGAVPPLDDF